MASPFSMEKTCLATPWLVRSLSMFLAMARPCRNHEAGCRTDG